MACEERLKAEEDLAKHVQNDLPDGFDQFDAELTDAGFFLSGSNLKTRSKVKYQGQAMVPKKAGGMKKHKIDVAIVTPFCPWCGKKQDENHP